MKKKGLLLQADDLEVGRLVTIHHWRDRRSCGLGHAYRLKALNLPYVVVQPLGGENRRPIILDLRQVCLMPISEEFADAQALTPPASSPPEPSALGDEDIPF